VNHRCPTASSCIGRGKRRKWFLEVIDAIYLFLSIIKFETHGGPSGRNMFERRSRGEVECFMELFDKSI
jgi:hypothetical protein